MSATGHRPICQDTGIVNVFLKVGMDVRWGGFTGSLDDAINEGVRRGYNHPDNTLRASVVADPQFDRKNTKDNTPAVIFTEIVPGNTRRGDGRGQGRRQREQEQAGHAQPRRQRRRLGAQDRADDGRRLVPAGHAGHRHRRHGREGRADGQGKPDGRPRHARAAGQEGVGRRTQQGRGAAHRAVREGQCAGHRRAGPGRPVDRARRQDQDVSRRTRPASRWR